MRFIWQIGVFGALLLGLPVPASAASFSRSYYGDCRVDITGPIVQGDYEALLELRDYLVIEDGESTSSSVVCLDSPGGSVLAGMKIAEFILEEGVSTRIPEGAECYSICAIIFMMGNYRGSEVSGISRRMHVSSQLGFHRPYLSLEEAGSYTSGDIEVSYELCIATVFEILTLANRRAPWGNERIIEPDLMARIMGTPGDQIYPILLVEEVLRWKISVDGIQLPSITR